MIRFLHYMHSIFMPQQHREQAMNEIRQFDLGVDALYDYMNMWYPYFLHDLEIRSTMVRHHGRVIKYFSDLQEMRLFVLDAVRNDGLAIQYCIDFQNDWEVAFEAISNDGIAYRYVSNDIQNNLDIMCLSLMSCPAMLNELPITDREYRNTLIAVNSSSYGFSDRVQRLAAAVYKHHQQRPNVVDD
tara:strand:+ start:562 stop:1119 length:558 start_codon:yes stop_codon:yes gene_type:complete